MLKSVAVSSPGPRSQLIELSVSPNPSPILLIKDCAELTKPDGTNVRRLQIQELAARGGYDAQGTRRDAQELDHGRVERISFRYSDTVAPLNAMPIAKISLPAVSNRGHRASHRPRECTINRIHLHSHQTPRPHFMSTQHLLPTPPPDPSTSTLAQAKALPYPSKAPLLRYLIHLQPTPRLRLPYLQHPTPTLNSAPTELSPIFPSPSSPLHGPILVLVLPYLRLKQYHASLNSRPFSSIPHSWPKPLSLSPFRTTFYLIPNATQRNPIPSQPIPPLVGREAKSHPIAVSACLPQASRPACPPTGTFPLPTLFVSWCGCGRATAAHSHCWPVF